MSRALSHGTGALLSLHSTLYAFLSPSPKATVSGELSWQVSLSQLAMWTKQTLGSGGISKKYAHMGSGSSPRDGIDLDNCMD